MISVQDSWSCGAIEQHCNACCAKADFDNSAGASQIWAPKALTGC